MCEETFTTISDAGKRLHVLTWRDINLHIIDNLV